MTRKVVVTGLGAISPLGLSAKSSWERLISGKSGVQKLRYVNDANLRSKVAGTVDREKFKSLGLLTPSECKKMDLFIQYGLVAAYEALNDAGIQQENNLGDRAGVIIGTGIGGLGNIQQLSQALGNDINSRVSPFFLPSSLNNLAPGHISIKYRFKGISQSVSAACASGNHALGNAMEFIKSGMTDIMVAGGTEAAVCEVGLYGFDAMRALSHKFNDTPELASRPWSSDRDGFVISEGAAMLVIEEYEHALKRGAHIYCMLSGYGHSSDAYHITSPHKDGEGAILCMGNALRYAGKTTADIDYINAHATSTAAGDEIELNAVMKLFGKRNCDRMYMSSTKSSTGHLLGAASAIEAVFSILALQNNIVPPTINLQDHDAQNTPINLVPKKAIKDRRINVALSNSFGFGGTNSAVVFEKI